MILFFMISSLYDIKIYNKNKILMFTININYELYVNSFFGLLHLHSRSKYIWLRKKCLRNATSTIFIQQHSDMRIIKSDIHHTILFFEYKVQLISMQHIPNQLLLVSRSTSKSPKLVKIQLTNKIILLNNQFEDRLYITHQLNKYN